ncbi:MAG: polyphosphate kinase 1 [Bdellovibrio sp.]
MKAKSPSKRASKRKPKVIEHPLASEEKFTNREIGWLNFNRRVLSQAEDTKTPLLERVKFLAICTSNLDEFFMKRVGGLKRQIAFNISAKSSDGKNPHQQLSLIRQEVLPMIQLQSQLFQKQLQTQLRDHGIDIVSWSELSEAEKNLAQADYLRNVFPVLTPLSVDPGHPFPFISNLSTSLGVALRNPESDEKLFARVKIPQVLPPWIQVSTGQFRFLSLLDLIQQNLQELFPHLLVEGIMPFRITRNADIEHGQEDAEDLLSQIEEELRMRRFADVVRLEHGPNPDPWILQFLMQELELKPEDLYEQKQIFDPRTLNFLAELKRPDLKDPPHTPAVPKVWSEEDPQSIIELLRRQDILVHHPFESFTASVERFIRNASEDPKVLAIKMTLYRTGDHSSFIQALIRAAESGKQVVCLVELKARFDEERNIYWAQELENAGVHVVYGVVGLKTHSKVALVVRQESEGLQCYAHIGTGNYNASSARVYTDLGLFTCREEITGEIVEFFHYLTGRSLKSDYRHLLIAPVNMFARFKYLIEREKENAKAKKPSGIIAKMNNMEENDISMALYDASQAGVDIHLLVRGFCCLRPGLRGLSEKIRVSSTIGRFLEHSRIFYFRNAAAQPEEGEFYIGSADWMYRNLHARIECVVPILDPSLKVRLWEILEAYRQDGVQTWDMDSEGKYQVRRSNALGDSKGVHRLLIEKAQAQASDEGAP